MDIEWWKDIPGFEGLYQASTKGRIRSVERWIERADGYRNHIMPRILKPQKNSTNNYLLVGLHDGKKNVKYLVHRLVAITFIPNPNNLPQVNHKDCNPQNNSVDNLEWCTALYNSNYGDIKEKQRASHLNRPDKSKPVEQYTRDGVYIATYPSIVEAYRQTGINHQSIGCCCQRKKSYITAGGFIWKYAKL